MSKIVDRIRKLMAQAQSDNAHEAALAAGMAQEMMFQYQISETDLVVEEKREAEPVIEGSIAGGNKKQRDVWKACLANGIAKGFGCEMYNSHDEKGFPRFQVYGIESVVQTVSYIYGYLVLEIERLCEVAWKGEGRAEVSFGEKAKARTWKNSFRMGAVNAIYRRLQEQRKEQTAQVGAMMAAAKAAKSAPSTALALYKTDEERVAEGYKELSKKLRLRSGRSSKTRTSRNAYQHGTEAGNNVALGGGRGLGAPAQRIGS